MQRGQREREARYLRFTIQRPGSLIYIPHLLAHAVLTVDTSSLTILSGRDAATTSNQQIILQTLAEYTFGVRRGKWREIFRKKDLSALLEWALSPTTGPRESKDRLQKLGNNKNRSLLTCYCHYTSKERFPVRIKVTASAPHIHLNTVIHIKAFLVQGLLQN